MMFRLILLLVLFTSVNYVIAQSGYGIIKATVYLKEIMPGALAVDEDGDPISQGPDTVYTIIMDLKKGKKPIWRTAWYNNKSYSLSSAPVTSSIVLGKAKKSGRTIQVIGQQKNTWILTLEPSGPIMLPYKYRNNRITNKMLLEGYLKHRKIHVMLPEPVELLSEEFM